MDMEFGLSIDTGSIETVTEYDHNHEVVYPAVFLALSFLVPITFLVVWCIVRKRTTSKSIEEAPRFLTPRKNRRNKKNNKLEY